MDDDRTNETNGTSEWTNQPVALISGISHALSSFIAVEYPTLYGVP